MVALDTVIHHLSRLGALIIRPISSFVVGLRQHSMRRAAISELCAMDDRIFDDIGVSRFQLHVMTHGSTEHDSVGPDLGRFPANSQADDTSQGTQLDNDNEPRLAA